MAQITRCEGCGIEGKSGQRWLRVRFEPFTVYNGSRGMDVCEAGYAEGMMAEACSPACACRLLAEQADTFAEQYTTASKVLKEMLDHSIIVPMKDPRHPHLSDGTPA